MSFFIILEYPRQTIPQTSQIRTRNRDKVLNATAAPEIAVLDDAPELCAVPAAAATATPDV